MFFYYVTGDFGLTNNQECVDEMNKQTENSWARRIHFFRRTRVAKN